MKIDKIIALKAPHNMGKSETLRNTWELLNTKFELIPIKEANGATKVCIYRDNTIHEAKEDSVDYHSLFLLNDNKYTKLGICTAGDDEKTIERAIDFFVKNECSVVIIACLTRGETVEILNGFSNDVTYIPKKRSLIESERYLLNKGDARVIFEAINELLSNTKKDRSEK